MKNVILFDDILSFNDFINNNKIITNNISFIEETNNLKLIKKQIKCYYIDFNQAIDDINNDEIGINGVITEENATCKIELINSKLNITLLNNVTTSKSINLNHNTNLNLNSFEITYNGETFININSNTKISNGKITCNPSLYTSEAYCTIINNANVNIDNVNIIGLSNGGGIENEPTSLIKLKNKSVLNIQNSSLTSNDENNGCTSNINIDTECLLIGNDNEFELTSPNGISANIHSNGNVNLTNCNLFAYANHTANEAGTYYATMSRAIFSPNGNVKLNNCNVYGTHSGITIRNGELHIDGGTYDGYSHGGIYFGNGNYNNYIYNANINDCALRGEGMYDDGVAGTNHAGMYVGGSSYINIYMNNCNVYGLQQPIVIKFSQTSSHDNHLYVSNSNINLDYKNYGVRNDGSNYITFGVNNNFNENNLKYKRNYYITDETYYFA
jgi:hypothetical protein